MSYFFHTESKSHFPFWAWISDGPLTLFAHELYVTIGEIPGICVHIINIQYMSSAGGTRSAWRMCIQTISRQKNVKLMSVHTKDKHSTSTRVSGKILCFVYIIYFQSARSYAGALFLWRSSNPLSLSHARLLIWIQPAWSLCSSGGPGGITTFASYHVPVHPHECLTRTDVDPHGWSLQWFCLGIAVWLSILPPVAN